VSRHARPGIIRIRIDRVEPGFDSTQQDESDGTNPRRTVADLVAEMLGNDLFAGPQKEKEEIIEFAKVEAPVAASPNWANPNGLSLSGTPI
jgi:hypothetical protein